MVDVNIRCNERFESVTLGWPQKGISADKDARTLVIVCANKVGVLVYSQSANTVHDHGLWADVPKGAGPFTVAVTKCGQTFLGGRDGHIYELVLQKRYFSRKKLAIYNRTKSWVPFWDGIKSCVFSPDPIAQLEFDESRSVLYALRERSSAIELYFVPQSGYVSWLSHTRTISNTFELAQRVAQFPLLSRKCGPGFADVGAFCNLMNESAQKHWERIWDTHFKRFIVSIHCVPKHDSEVCSLVAVTSQGVILHFSASGELVTVVPPPLQLKPVSACHVSGPCVYSEGTAVISFTKEGPTKENFLLCCSILDVGERYIKSVKAHKLRDSDHVLSIYKRPISGTAMPSQPNLPHLLAEQFRREPLSFFVEISSGLFTCGNNWPVAILRKKILSGSLRLEGDVFFKIVDLREVYAMCIFLYCSAASGESCSENDKVTLTSTAKDVFKKYSFSLGLDALKELRTGGVLAFMARTVQPILNSVIASQDKKDSVWSAEQIKKEIGLLSTAQGFIKECEGSVNGRKIFVEIKVLGIVLETLNFVLLVRLKKGLFVKVLKHMKPSPKDICVKDFVFNERVRSAFLRSLIDVVSDTENSDVLRSVEEKCPFYFMCLKASPEMKDISTLKKRPGSSENRRGYISGREELEDSLDFYIETPGVDIDFICSKYVASNFYVGALRLALSKGEKFCSMLEGSSAPNPSWTKAKAHCYGIAISVLDRFNGTSQEKDELVKVCLSFTMDKDWNKIIWGWCIEHGFVDTVIRCSPRGLLVEYLSSRGDPYDTMWKCYREDGDQPKAFDYLFSSAVSNEVCMNVDKRIELMITAIGFAECPRISRSEIARAQRTLDLLTFQLRLKEQLGEGRYVSLGGEDIAKKVLPLDVLIRDYAMKHKLYDLVVEGMKLGNIRRRDVVEKAYAELLFGRSQRGQSIIGVLTSMGRQFYSKEDSFFFPVEFLLSELFSHGFMSTDVVGTLHECGVSYFEMFSYFRRIHSDGAATLLVSSCVKDFTSNGELGDITLEQLVSMRDFAVDKGMIKDTLTKIDGIISLIKAKQQK